MRQKDGMREDQTDLRKKKTGLKKHTPGEFDEFLFFLIVKGRVR
jgi:hypothetical protein